jgi:hypothetical protein
MDDCCEFAGRKKRARRPSSRLLLHVHEIHARLNRDVAFCGDSLCSIVFFLFFFPLFFEGSFFLHWELLLLLVGVVLFFLVACADRSTMATTHLSAASAFSVDLRIIGTGDAKQSTKAAVVKKTEEEEGYFIFYFFQEGREREKEGKVGGGVYICMWWCCGVVAEVKWEEIW